ncbi:TOBE domain-containing protein [Baekduia soli]|uniref:TOBE domain-containing protein n=1 Tax=Baekduia soli TaxID=496014 RepID=UPI00225DD595|nr:TOBE domain-containing protein [Baekduia soli]
MTDDPRPDDWIRIGAAASALGVSVDTLRRWERDGRVRFQRRGRQRYLPAATLAELMRDRHRDHAASGHTRLAGVVLSVQRDGVMAQVELACGPYRVTSLMAGAATDDLGLKPGDPAVAVIASTAVVVEAR